MSQDVIPPLVGRLHDDSRPHSHADAIFANLSNKHHLYTSKCRSRPGYFDHSSVGRDRQTPRERIESPIIATNRSNRLWTKYNVKMDAVGRREAMILITCVFLSILESG
jgi:hypothetical protein